MIGAINELSESSRLLSDLQQVNAIAQDFSSCLDPDKISLITSNGLVTRFNSALSRIWLVEPSGAELRLVASSGLSNRTDGSFARVAMGAYKVGKIARNRVSFLSNNLPEEVWVKDRDWAIANHIRGFAGFPLISGDRVIGVLATFSHEALSPEFLEVLQVLCTTVSIALDAAQQYQQKLKQSADGSSGIWEKLLLSDQLAAILHPVRLTLIGTEEAIAPSHAQVFLQFCEMLSRAECRRCRLTYGKDAIILEATAVISNLNLQDQNAWLRSQLGLVSLMAAYLGGQLHSQTGTDYKVIQAILSLPYPNTKLGFCIQIQCRSPTLQLAFTYLSQAAGLAVDHQLRTSNLILTDDPQQITSDYKTIWIKQPHTTTPKAAIAEVDVFTTTPEQLRDLVTAIDRSEIPEIHDQEEDILLSEREREILELLTQGLRDRDIANRLIISESTVKFHMNNLLTKFKARTRYQVLYQAILKGWLR